MADLARALRVSETDVDVEMLKTIFMYCGAGLTISLVCASWGLDLSPGSFWGDAHRLAATPANPLP
jgi:hypothetical protein